jgi:hypothetical protein
MTDRDTCEIEANEPAAESAGASAAAVPQAELSPLDMERMRLEELAPRPNTVADTGLDEAFLVELVSKHLLEGGILTLADLSSRLALSGPIVRSLLEFMRAEARIEVRGVARDGSSANLRYALTDLGRASAQDAMSRSGYVGAAPVPLDAYIETVTAQTVHGVDVRSEDMNKVFADIVLRDELRDQIGPALNSGRAIFIYGHAGTGKTFISQKLVRLFPDKTLVPYSIAIGETVVEVYDPVLHKKADLNIASPNIMLGDGHDPRYACCERPRIVAGGELTADMLEIKYDASTRRYQAPMQLKANNGIFIIDDMGRQRVAPETVFNRWIVPLEEKIDYLSLGSGRHFSVPFDVILLFSTNLHPTDIADEAFLRRIGYKIKFPMLEPAEYEEIWNNFIKENNISVDDDALEYTVRYLHRTNGVPLLPCHPRDLLSMAAEMSVYHGGSRHVTKESMQMAWDNYFVLSKPDNYVRPSPSGDGGTQS